MSLDELKKDLLILEPDIRPKEQMTIDRYLYENNKFFMLFKGFVPIPEFSINPDRSIANSLQLENKSFKELHGLNVSEKMFLSHIPRKILKNT